MMNETIDLRSDTVTWPTPAMRQAMAAAPVGDDVYGDDPTVNELEREAARLLGKEAALFAASGTMGNQLALMAQVVRGNEVILSDRCHIVFHEAGAAAILSGAQLRCLPVHKGQMALEDVEKAIRKTPEDIHSPRTDLICLETADSDGVVLPLDYLRAIRALASRYKIPVHLDGARLFNAATALATPVQEIAACADTIQICLSKGLCAPIGSLLVGPAETIALARRKRKILGGGMRQAGILAAAGLIALREMRLRLQEDHATARWLADQLARRPDWFELVRQPEINMVFFRLTGYPVAENQLADKLAEQRILINGPDEHVFRFVTHYWVTPDDAATVVALLVRLAQEA
jgi:threonine aldolase